MIMTITDNRIKALDDLGFEWSSGKSRKVNAGRSGLRMVQREIKKSQYCIRSIKNRSCESLIVILRSNYFSELRAF